MTELFNFTTVYKADASTPAGTIIDQSPAAQSSRMIVPEGIKVTLTVSSGVQLVTVPDEINQPYNEAQVALQSLGLNVEIELVASDSVTANYIISMDPQPGSSISSGSTIELVVSAGPTVTYVTVPDVVGMEKTQALLEVQQQGLVCAETEITYISSTEEEKGLVLWQNYASGTSVVTGTKLYLQIGSGPAGQ
jgi:serine/threonine-protein kinase